MKEQKPAVPRYYKYIFLSIFLMAGMTIAGWTLLYVVMEEVPLSWFYLNSAVSIPLLGVIIMVTYKMVAKAVLKECQAQEAMSESEGRFRGIAEVANDAIVVTDSGGTIKYWNTAGQKIFQLAAEDVLGSKIDRVIPGFTGGLDACIADTSPASGVALCADRALEMVGIRRDGTRVPIEVSMSAVGTNGDRNIEAIIRDITWRKRTDQALRESEAKYHGLYSSIKDGIIMTDMSGIILNCNDAGLKLLGYREDELVGMPSDRLMPERFRGVEQVAAVGGIKGWWFSTEHEMAFLTRSDLEFPVSVRSWLAEGTDDSDGVWMIFRDISERKAAEETISKQAEELRNLIDIAAHELRHPATVFKGYAYLLLQRDRELDPETVEQALRGIDESATRLASLVNELLDISRIERGKMDMTFDPVDPNKLIMRAVEEMRWKERDVEFSMSEGYCGDVLLADGEKIKQVLSILLDNASKYSPLDGVVETWCESDGGEVIFHVADKGPGIPPEERLRIFERFHQVEDVLHHSLPGLGLGLYIARTIVQAHSGWIRVQPRTGGGSIFSFGIPNGASRPISREEIVGL